MAAKIYTDLSKLKAKIEELKKQGKTIGWITGTFDIVHVGHIRFIRWAKQNCDILVLGLASDELTKANKGPDRPFFKAAERAELISELQGVDFVLKMENPGFALQTEEAKSNITQITSEIGPNIIMAGEKTDGSFEVKRKIAKQIGAKFIPYFPPPPTSSTEIAEKISAMET